MEDSLYEIIEATGTSVRSFDDAVAVAISNAVGGSRHLRSFTVIDTRGTISGDAVESWQVKLKIGFTTVSD